MYMGVMSNPQFFGMAGARDKNASKNAVRLAFLAFITS